MSPSGFPKLTTIPHSASSSTAARALIACPFYPKRIAVGHKPCVERVELSHRGTARALSRLDFQLARLTSERLKQVLARMDPIG